MWLGSREEDVRKENGVSWKKKITEMKIREELGK